MYNREAACQAVHNLNKNKGNSVFRKMKWKKKRKERYCNAENYNFGIATS